MPKKTEEKNTKGTKATKTSTAKKVTTKKPNIKGKFDNSVVKNSEVTEAKIGRDLFSCAF